MSEGAKTGFVVKAANAAGHEMWVSPPRVAIRVFGPRQNAEVFETQKEARAAISSLSEAFARAGFAFTVESTD